VSEYQYYEFQAVDRPLTPEEMRTLRRFSTRATITPTRFVNEYHWGDFKGDPFAWMEDWFDAFLYLANWGTHELMLRLPRRLLDRATAGRYCVGDAASAAESGDHLILTFSSEEEGGDWLEDGNGMLASILPVRAEIERGDHRALYLAWLLCIQYADEDEDEENDEPEPPVPPGLGELSAAQHAFADFLRIDEDLIAAAAERSPALPAEPGADEIRAWVAALADAEKTALLVRVAQGRGGAVGAELVRRMRAEQAPPAARGEPRTAADLLAAAERTAAERLRVEKERAAREKARADAEKAAARARYLDGLAGVEGETWARVDALIDSMQPKRYDEAVQLLVDLRDLAVRDGRGDEALARIEEIRARHERKSSFRSRLARAIPRGTGR
jgi:hypothetical protein